MKVISIHLFFSLLSLIHAIKKSEQVTVLPLTPKGLLLDNIYGQNRLKSTYGPNMEAFQTTLNVFDSFGNIKTIYVNNSILNKPQPNVCDFRDRHSYKICQNLDCDFCMASPHCGKKFLFYKRIKKCHRMVCKHK